MNEERMNKGMKNDNSKWSIRKIKMDEERRKIF